MKTDKMHPLPWRHWTDGKRMSAIRDANGHVVAGSLMVQMPGTGTKDRQTHAYIVEAVSWYEKMKGKGKGNKTICPNCKGRWSMLEPTCHLCGYIDNRTEGRGDG